MATVLCRICSGFTQPHTHTDLGIPGIPMSEYARFESDGPNTYTCLHCGFAADVSTPKIRNLLIAHLTSHGSTVRSLEIELEEKEEIPKKGEKATPPNKEKTKRTKAKPAGEAPVEAAERRHDPDARIYKKRSTEKSASVWTYIPRAILAKVMNRKALGGPYAAFCREAWKSHTDASHEAVPPGPLVGRRIRMKWDEANAVVAFEKAGGNFDAFIYARLKTKLDL
jgi:hypothetical protein